MDKSVFNQAAQNENITSKIVVGLERISEAFRVLLWEHAKVLGLSPIQIQLLIFVAYHSEHLCNVSHLAKEFNLTKPTISDAIKVLVNKEFIQKIPSATDKRAYSVALTNKGEKIVQNTKHFTKPISKGVNQLNATEQTNLFASISKLIFDLNRNGILSIQRTCFGCRFYQKTDNHHYCQLIKTDLLDKDIRLDCPEFEVKTTL